MRILRVTAVGLLALLVVAACVPASELVEIGAVATAAQQPAAASDSAAPAPTASPEPPPSEATATSAPLGGNVAVLGFGRASTWSDSAHLAIDGDLETMWNAKALPFQWFSVVLNDTYMVDRIELVVAQTPSGPTTHEIWLESSFGTRTLFKRLVNVHTEDGQILDFVIDPPRNVSELLINTYDNPSWVAWREVRVFGSPAVNAQEEAGAPRFKLKRVASGLELPVQITHAGDGSGRLFVVEQKGRIRIIKDGAVNDTPFLEISDKISYSVEQGLLGIAFPPDYAAKQHFYISYTNVDGHTIISRHMTTSEPDRADPDSEEVVLTIDQPAPIHNGGRIVFGPQDGYLYVGSGDGETSRNPEINGQDPGTLLGKILRIDVESGVKPYAIPPDNPFTQVESYRDEIWALGLRNPWNFAFDKLTGALYIPDVGNKGREEVSFQPAASRGGENYGWRIMEGSLCLQPSSGACNAEILTSPVAEYKRTHGCAIVGGAVYRGSGPASLQGAFIFADFCRGTVWTLKRPDVDDHDGWQSSLLLNAGVPVSSIGEDEEGTVYVTGYQDGSISMITER